MLDELDDAAAMILWVVRPMPGTGTLRMRNTNAAARLFSISACRAQTQRTGNLNIYTQIRRRHTLLLVDLEPTGGEETNIMVGLHLHANWTM